jgi:hypothetical protein
VVETLEQRSREAIERSRALLARSGERLDRQEAAVQRVEARRDRHQAEINRASAEGERNQATMLPDPGEAIERAKALAQQARKTMRALAAVEEEIAGTYELLAARRQDRRDEHQRTAEHARNRARKTREDLRTFPSDNRAARPRAGFHCHAPVDDRTWDRGPLRTCHTSTEAPSEAPCGASIARVLGRPHVSIDGVGGTCPSSAGMASIRSRRPTGLRGGVIGGDWQSAQRAAWHHGRQHLRPRGRKWLRPLAQQFEDGQLSAGRR